MDRKKGNRKVVQGHSRIRVLNLDYAGADLY